jgi:hypothetical protein
LSLVNATGVDLESFSKKQNTEESNRESLWSFRNKDEPLEENMKLGNMVKLI